jgi:hypothetical protein
MSKIVVVGGFVQCSHGGRARLTSGSGQLRIGGADAVVSGGEVGLSFLPPEAPPTPDHPVPCPVKGPGTPPPSTPCSATVAATAGVSTEVRVGGLGVLLDTASGQAVNVNDPSARWTIAEAGQAVVDAG